MTDLLPIITSVAAVILSALALALAAGATLRLARLERAVQGSTRGLPNGSVAPLKPLETLIGSGNSEMWMEGPSLIIFASAACPPCRELMETIEDLATPFSGRVLVADVGADTETLRRMVRSDAAKVRNDQDRILQHAFGSDTTPHSFLVLHGEVADQAIGSDIQRLVEHARTGAKQTQTTA